MTTSLIGAVLPGMHEQSYEDESREWAETDPAISCPELPLDADQARADVLIKYADRNPKVRRLAIKMLASRGFVAALPQWPEISSVAVHVDQQTMTLPNHAGQHLVPDPYDPPPPVAPSTMTSAATGSMTAEAFFAAIGRPETPEAKIARVRRENAERSAPGHPSGLSRRMRNGLKAASSPTRPSTGDGVIIALLPAAVDLVNQLAADDAHLTLCWLGESVDLDAADDLAGIVEIAAGEFSPFSVDVSGIAVLGDDHANVLLVESPILTRLRDRLITAPPVKSAMAATDQHPGFVAHITLDYDADPKPVDIPQAVKIDRLALWNGAQRVTVPLSGTGTKTPKPHAQLG